MAEDSTAPAQPGQGSILSGSLDMSNDTARTLGMVCNVIFASMTLGMCNSLMLGMGNALNGPLLSTDLAAAVPTTPLMSMSANSIGGPAIPTPRMGGLLG